MTETAPSTRRDARRDSIIEAARQVFFEEGFAAASMSTIAARLGGSKGTLYNYFKSKEELFEAHVRETCSHMGGPVFELPQPTGQETPADVARTLIGLGERFLNFLMTERAMRTYQLVTAEAHRTPELARIFYEAGPQAGIARVAHYLESAKAMGLIAPPDCEAAAQQLIALFKGHLHLLYALNLVPRPTAKQIKDEVEQSVSLFISAYGVAGA